MSKKKKRPDSTIQEELLDDMLECNTKCADLGAYQPIRKRAGLAEIEHLLKVLPGMGYIENQLVDHLFSDGVTTGSIPQDKVLDEFLYRKNIQGNTNLAVLRDVIMNASVYGETGLRWYDGNIYMVQPGTYGALIRKENGIKYPAVFFCSEDGHYVSDEEVPKEQDFEDALTPEDIVRIFKDRKLVLLDTENFVNVRNDTSKLHGDSPLLRDTLRIDLLESVYSRLGYDVEYDGPGRLILRPKDGYVTGDVNEVATSSVMNQSVMAASKRLENAQKEVKRVGEEVKNSSSDSVILLSNAFDKEITKLERVTKATEFFDWISNEGEILSQAVGLAPSLLELGDISGNVSMQRILDDAMINTVVPLREQYATQFSELIARKLGISKVCFGKYQLASAPDRETMILKVVESMNMLNSIETPKAKQLIDDLADRISYDIHNDDGSLVELAIKGSFSDDKEKSK